jgi:hypothetical protein
MKRVPINEVDGFILSRHVFIKDNMPHDDKTFCKVYNSVYSPVSLTYVFQHITRESFAHKFLIAKDGTQIHDIFTKTFATVVA